MFKLLLSWLINAFSIWVASLVVDGIQLGGTVFQILLVALIFGLINALIKPILTFFAAPLIVVTLGIVTLLINALLLVLTSWLTDALMVESLGSAILGALIISLVSWALGLLLGD